MNRDTKVLKNRVEAALGVEFFEHHTPGARGSEITTPYETGESRVVYGTPQKLEGFFEGVNWVLDTLARRNPEVLVTRLADVAPEAILAAAKEVKKKDKKKK